MDGVEMLGREEAKVSGRRVAKVMTRSDGGNEPEQSSPQKDRPRQLECLKWSDDNVSTYFPDLSDDSEGEDDNNDGSPSEKKKKHHKFKGASSSTSTVEKKGVADEKKGKDILSEQVFKFTRQVNEKGQPLTAGLLAGCPLAISENHICALSSDSVVEDFGTSRIDNPLDDFFDRAEEETAVEVSEGISLLDAMKNSKKNIEVLSYQLKQKEPSGYATRDKKAVETEMENLTKSIAMPTMAMKQGIRTGVNKEYALTLESSHPSPPGYEEFWLVNFPREDDHDDFELEVRFDPRCYSEKNVDYLKFYTCFPVEAKYFDEENADDDKSHGHDPWHLVNKPTVTPLLNRAMVDAINASINVVEQKRFYNSASALNGQTNCRSMIGSKDSWRIKLSEYFSRNIDKEKELKAKKSKSQNRKSVQESMDEAVASIGEVVNAGVRRLTVAPGSGDRSPSYGETHNVMWNHGQVSEHEEAASANAGADADETTIYPEMILDLGCMSFVNGIRIQGENPDASKNQITVGSTVKLIAKYSEHRNPLEEGHTHYKKMDDWTGKEAPMKVLKLYPEFPETPYYFTPPLSKEDRKSKQKKEQWYPLDATDMCQLSPSYVTDFEIYISNADVKPEFEATFYEDSNGEQHEAWKKIEHVEKRQVGQEKVPRKQLIFTEEGILHTFDERQQARWLKLRIKGWGDVSGNTGNMGDDLKKYREELKEAQKESADTRSSVPYHDTMQFASIRCAIQASSLSHYYEVVERDYHDEEALMKNDAFKSLVKSENADGATWGTFSGGASAGDYGLNVVTPLRIKARRFVVFFRTDKEEGALNHTSDWGFRIMVTKRGKVSRGLSGVVKPDVLPGSICLYSIGDERETHSSGDDQEARKFFASDDGQTFQKNKYARDINRMVQPMCPNYHKLVPFKLSKKGVHRCDLCIERLWRSKRERRPNEELKETYNSCEECRYRVCEKCWMAGSPVKGELIKVDPKIDAFDLVFPQANPYWECVKYYAGERVMLKGDISEDLRKDDVAIIKSGPEVEEGSEDAHYTLTLNGADYERVPGSYIMLSTKDYPNGRREHFEKSPVFEPVYHKSGKKNDLPPARSGLIQRNVKLKISKPAQMIVDTKLQTFLAPERATYWELKIESMTHRHKNASPIRVGWTTVRASDVESEIGLTAFDEVTFDGSFVFCHRDEVPLLSDKGTHDWWKKYTAFEAKNLQYAPDSESRVDSTFKPGTVIGVRLKPSGATGEELEDLLESMDWTVDGKTWIGAEGHFMQMNPSRSSVSNSYERQSSETLSEPKRLRACFTAMPGTVVSINFGSYPFVHAKPSGDSLSFASVMSDRSSQQYDKCHALQPEGEWRNMYILRAPGFSKEIAYLLYEEKQKQIRDYLLHEEKQKKIRDGGKMTNGSSREGGRLIYPHSRIPKSTNKQKQLSSKEINHKDEAAIKLSFADGTTPPSKDEGDEKTWTETMCSFVDTVVPPTGLNLKHTIPVDILNVRAITLLEGGFCVLFRTRAILYSIKNGRDQLISFKASKEEPQDLVFAEGWGRYLCIATKHKVWLFHKDQKGAWSLAPLIANTDTGQTIQLTKSFEEPILGLNMNDGKLAIVTDQGYTPKGEIIRGKFHPLRLDRPNHGEVSVCHVHELDPWGTDQIHERQGFQKVSVNKDRYILSFSSGKNQSGFGSIILSFGEQYPKPTDVVVLSGAGPTVISSHQSGGGYALLGFDLNSQNSSKFISRGVSHYGNWWDKFGNVQMLLQRTIKNYRSGGNTRSAVQECPTNHGLLTIENSSDLGRYVFSCPGAELGISGGLSAGGSWIQVGNAVVNFSILFGGCDIDFLEAQTYDDDQLYCLFTMALQDECSCRPNAKFIDNLGWEHSFPDFPSVFQYEEFPTIEKSRHNMTKAEADERREALYHSKIKRVEKAAQYLIVVWDKLKSLQVTTGEKTSDVVAKAIAKRMHKLAMNILDPTEEGIAAVWSMASDDEKEKLKYFMCQPVMVLLLEHIWYDRLSFRLFFFEAMLHVAVIVIFGMAMYEYSATSTIDNKYFICLLPLLIYQCARKVFTMGLAMDFDSKLRSKTSWYNFSLNVQNQKIPLGEFVKDVINVAFRPVAFILMVIFLVLLRLVSFSARVSIYIYFNLTHECTKRMEHCPDILAVAWKDVDVPTTINYIEKISIFFVTDTWTWYWSMVYHVRYAWPVSLIYYIPFAILIEPILSSDWTIVMSCTFGAWTCAAAYLCQARSWRNEPFNAIDIIGSLLPLVTFNCLRLSSIHIDDTARDYLIASTTLMLYLKLLGIVRGFGRKFATFVIMLKFVVHDVKEFMIVMCIFIIGFAQCFYVLFLYKNMDLDDPEDDVGSGFFGMTISFYSILNLMLGNYDDETYLVKTEAAVLFVLFMIAVVIVMLNVLIAIVSDSYDVAMVNSNELYHFAQFEIIMELQPVLSFGHNIKQFFRLVFVGDDGRDAAKAREDATIEAIKDKVSDSLISGDGEDTGRIFDTVNRITKKTEHLTKPMMEKLGVVERKVRSMDEAMRSIQEGMDVSSKKMDKFLSLHSSSMEAAQGDDQARLLVSRSSSASSFSAN